MQNTIPHIEGKQRILIAPLNWGLGHATRCIPLILEMLQQGHYILIASDALPLEVLKVEFPLLDTIEFPSFPIHYSKGKSQVTTILKQLPSILSGIRREHRMLQEIIRQHNLSMVISDNRFGLWTKQVPCIYITHQLMIKMPRKLKALEPIAWLLHRCVINRYKVCWIPDFEGENGLSGDLAHKYPLPKNARFIGLLSRFFSTKNIIPKDNYHTIVVISGPEPQRSLFENEMIEKLKGLDKSVLIVQGLPQNEIQTKQIENITLVSQLSSEELKAQLLSSKEIICRSGYSSIMDLFALGKKAIFIPTPGQTEQEYLATINS